jgi:type 1 glutamine amidotransferase
LTKAFGGKGFLIKDEIYMFEAPYSRSSQRVLLSLDMSKPRNEKRGMPDKKRPDNDYAISWIRDFGKGRVFYCSIGHNNEIYSNPVMLRYYLAGIQWAIGDLKADATPSAKLNPKPAPALAPDD